MRIADRGHAHKPAVAEGTHHVQHDACLPRLVKWREWRATMSNRSLGVSPAYRGLTTGSLATRHFSCPLGAVNTAVSGSYFPSVRNWRDRNGCVVPPLRRLSSIAYGVHDPSFSRTVTKSIANRPSTPSAASRAPTFA